MKYEVIIYSSSVKLFLSIICFSEPFINSKYFMCPLNMLTNSNHEYSKDISIERKYFEIMIAVQIRRKDILVCPKLSYSTLFCIRSMLLLIVLFVLYSLRPLVGRLYKNW